MTSLAGVSSATVPAPATARGPGSALLVLPALAFVAVFFAFPLGWVVAQSFDFPTFTLANYAWAFADPTNVRVLLNTVLTSLAATAIVVVLGYPFAYLMSISTSSGRNLLLAIVLIPFWISIMVRTFAWAVLLQANGVVSRGAEMLGFGQLELLHTPAAVLIGMTQILLPFAVMPMYATMSAIDLRLVLASQSLGAGPARTFWRVYLPLSIPGVLAGGLLVFVQALGFYVTPALLGSPSDSMLSQQIYTQISTLLDWGRGSALAVVLAIITLIAIGLFGLLSRSALRKVAK